MSYDTGRLEGIEEGKVEIDEETLAAGRSPGCPSQ